MRLKCKDCDSCRKGFFKSKPDDYVCIGVPEPFIIKDINNECTEYKDNSQDIRWAWGETYSDNLDHGVFDTKEEAIQDALEYIDSIKEYTGGSAVINIGKCTWSPVRTDVDPDMIMEYLDDLYCEDTCCDYYIYEGVTDTDKKWLEDRLSDLMKEFNRMIGLSPGYFDVISEEEIDLDEYVK